MHAASAGPRHGSRVAAESAKLDLLRLVKRERRCRPDALQRLRPDDLGRRGDGRPAEHAHLWGGRGSRRRRRVGQGGGARPIGAKSGVLLLLLGAGLGVGRPGLRHHQLPPHRRGRGSRFHRRHLGVCCHLFQMSDGDLCGAQLTRRGRWPTCRGRARQSTSPALASDAKVEAPPRLGGRPLGGRQASRQASTAAATQRGHLLVVPLVRDPARQDTARGRAAERRTRVRPKRVRPGHAVWLLLLLLLLLLRGGGRRLLCARDARLSLPRAIRRRPPSRPPCVVGVAPVDRSVLRTCHQFDRPLLRLRPSHTPRRRLIVGCRLGSCQPLHTRVLLLLLRGRACRRPVALNLGHERCAQGDTVRYDERSLLLRGAAATAGISAVREGDASVTSSVTSSTSGRDIIALLAAAPTVARCSAALEPLSAAIAAMTSARASAARISAKSLATRAVSAAMSSFSTSSSAARSKSAALIGSAT